MTPRVLRLIWVILGLVVGSAIFDAWMYRETQSYLLLAQQFDVGRAEEPELAVMMANARADGFLRAVVWFVLIAGSGWGTIHLLTRRDT
jgi:hypothetical protein